ncbi:hypothetical protein J1N35_001055 [Gossypium stocksii]|uniref:Uncharacterized protein n=1 Tax=Gossypium stocksii TaxID=47602 RepID=A0A9D4AKP5_9ROSI|nr:hypothetical protein J1N35_001055 [Gossypium stocksii]
MSKSHKRIRSSKTSVENHIVIQGEEVKERFDSIFKNQPTVPKKGFNLESNDKMVVPLPIRKMIETLNWNYFCNTRSLLEEELVQDFCTNLTKPNATEVLVHKKKVPLTYKSINELFNLPDVEEDEYFALMKNINLDFLQQVLNVVTNSGFQ